MSYSTDFVTAVKSIYEERTGKGSSRIKRETGLTFEQWRGHMTAFFDVMWPPPDTFGNPRKDVVRDYAIASAVLEWASINAGDAFDKGAHNDSGPQFDKPAGKGASIGPFQGYAAESYKALRDHPDLRRMIKSLSARTKPVGDIFEGVYGGGRVPASGGTQTISPDQDRRLRNVLSEYETLKDPFVSLIGKLQLSVDYARDTMMDHTLGSQTQNSHMWRLPDRVLRHVLLSYEVSGGDDDWLPKCAKIIWDADTANNFSSNPPNGGLVLKFPWKKAGRLGSVYEALGMSSYDECKYSELVNIW